jgi:hypothetical protein
MSAAYFAFTAGGVLLILRVIADHVQPHMAVALPLLLLGSALMLSISMAGGARLSTVSNAIIAFAFYGIAFIGGWIEQIGTMTAASSARNIGTVISLVSPIDALWRRAAVEMSPGLTGLQFSPFGAPSNAGGATRDDRVGCRLHGGGGRARRRLVFGGGRSRRCAPWCQTPERCQTPAVPGHPALRPGWALVLRRIGARPR